MGSDPIFPGWRGERTPLAHAREAGGRVAGRYLRGATRDLLEDESATVEVATAGPRPQHGDQVAARLEPAAGAGPDTLHDVEVLAPAARALTPELLHAARVRPNLRRRAAVVRAIRAVLDERGFLEVETPARVVNPGLEPHLRPFATRGSDGDRWLVTSPELHLKRLLAAGYERFFELARVFRDEERGARHAPEFLMLEWYRSHATLADLADDLAAMLPRCARAAGVDPATGVTGCDLALAPLTVTYRAVFRDLAGRDCDGLDPAERDELFASAVEPRLGRGRAHLVTDWPADASALARLRRDDDGRTVAARMELYVAGMELANGFDELNDPAEQRRRHEADREHRRRAGTAVPDLDEGFLAALETGVPPSAGMALGVDRLVMALLGCRSIDEVRPFPA